MPTNNEYLTFPIDSARRYPTERTLLLQKSNAYTPWKKISSMCKTKHKIMDLQAEIHSKEKKQKLPEIVDAQTKPVRAYYQ
jgi:hypothetical protein